MVTPNLVGFDHAHVYVGSRSEAEKWYRRVLNFKPVEALIEWAVESGPLTVENPQGTIHLALFEREAHAPASSVAFKASGAEFLAWKPHLEAMGLELRLADHRLAYSMYFSDPWGNHHEITTYERDHVAARLA